MPKVLVVDDHHLIISGSFNVLQRQYSDLEIYIATTAQEAFYEIERIEKENSVFDLIILDISIPEKTGMEAHTDTGIELIKKILDKYPTQNVMVQSSHAKTLVRIKYEIDEHEGGFAIADKGLSEQEMLNRVDLAIQGATYTIDIRNGIEMKPEWLELLRLAFNEGLQDQTIAQRTHRHERTVRSYWSKTQDALKIYPEDCKREGKNIRILTEIRAREEGLID